MCVWIFYVSSSVWFVYWSEGWLVVWWVKLVVDCFIWTSSIACISFLNFKKTASFGFLHNTKTLNIVVHGGLWYYSSWSSYSFTRIVVIYREYHWTINGGIVNSCTCNTHFWLAQCNRFCSKFYSWLVCTKQMSMNSIRTKTSNGRHIHRSVEG